MLFVKQGKVLPFLQSFALIILNEIQSLALVIYTKQSFAYTFLNFYPTYPIYFLFNSNDSGLLKVCEVVSRIKDLDLFISGVENLGFKLISKNVENKMFVFLDFHSVVISHNHSQSTLPQLEPCLYKKR